ncbi:hypothetical protein GCM10012287_40640 [Streptomyces daqingensis]|uniref:Uncharacterized protein n=1 Tax=Streptomyces daqingensis TaxID=1472640 RepID=A0ABQ2ML00_9ACTN|nr:hypothetical protein GCM10012287_40640 [Streptomyces daqingensis]
MGGLWAGRAPGPVVDGRGIPIIDSDARTAGDTTPSWTVRRRDGTEDSTCAPALGAGSLGSGALPGARQGDGPEPGARKPGGSRGASSPGRPQEGHMISRTAAAGDRP